MDAVLVPESTPEPLAEGLAVPVTGDAASCHGSRHIFPANLDIKVTFRVIQDNRVGSGKLLLYNNSVLK